MAALQPKLTTMPKSTSLLPHDSDDEMVVIRDDDKKRSPGDEKKRTNDGSPWFAQGSFIQA
jgi:hypothetical protein